MSDLVEIPVPGSAVPMMATNVDGRPMVALRPMCEALGLNYSTQFRKLGIYGAVNDFPESIWDEVAA